MCVCGFQNDLLSRPVVYLSPDLEQKQILKLKDIVLGHQVSGKGKGQKNMELCRVIANELYFLPILYFLGHSYRGAATSHPPNIPISLEPR